MNPSNPPPPRRRARLFHEMGRASPNSMSQAAGTTGEILTRMKQNVALPGQTTPAGTLQAFVSAAPLVGRSGQRRVGNVGVSKCRPRWWAYKSEKKRAEHGMDTQVRRNRETD